MNVSQLMTQGVYACSIHDSLARAAQTMWEYDCGCIPVVDDDNRVVGMLTDRDVCMAGYTQGRVYSEIPVSTAMSKQVFGVRENDLLEMAETLMRNKQLRRLPVLDQEGKLRGVLSIHDLVRHTQPSNNHRSNGLSGDTIAHTLAAIGEPLRHKSDATSNGHGRMIA